MDEHVAHTVAYLLQGPQLLVPEAMQACKFTLEESLNLNHSKQMLINCAFDKATGGKLAEVHINALTTAMTTVSPLTSQTPLQSEDTHQL